MVVATRDRPVRLRWLLNSLEEQSAPARRFQVVVVHDGESAPTQQLLRSHPLSRSGQLECLTASPGRTHPGAMRNLGWHAASAPLILFTDDDCRPAIDWLERALTAAALNPGSVIQGATLPDPDEAVVAETAPWVRTLHVAPPTPWAETCNIAYPRAWLERVGGFDDDMRVGEDTDLWLRVRRAGGRLVPAPDMLCYHAVEEHSLLETVRTAGRWRDLALLARRHPEVRRHLWGRMWWKPEHAAFLSALLGAALAGRSRTAAAALALPWVLGLDRRGYGAHPRALARSLAEAPGRALIDAAELVGLARGSIRYRTLLL